MEAKSLLTVRNLKKHFPVLAGGGFRRKLVAVKAVDGVTFSIGEGETVALIGESGCGKSTTANLILRLETPTEGEVLLRGGNVHEFRGDDYRSYRQQMQAVFQDPWSSLNPRMRVKHIIGEPIKVNRKDMQSKDISRRVAQVMQDVGLDPLHADRFPHEFSGGQRQRIAVGAALASEPSIIILDEPVSALDVSIRAQIMNMFRDIQQKYGVSYLLIAHDLGTARYLADRIAVMYLGRIVEYAPTGEIFHNPMHPYTQALFSAALPSHPDLEREEIVLEGEVPSPVAPPSGCPFHTRCPMKIGEVCERVVPELEGRELERRLVACHLYGVSE